MERRSNSHASRTSRHLPTLTHALHLAPAIRFRLADHVVVVERLTARPDEERGTKQRSGAGANLGDLGDMVGKGSRVQERFSRESVIDGGQERLA